MIVANGNRKLAGNEARNWTTGCSEPARRGVKPMATPMGTQITVLRINKQGHTRKRRQSHEQRLAHFSQTHFREDEAHTPDTQTNSKDHEQRIVQPVIVPVVRRHGAARGACGEQPGAGGAERLTQRGKDTGQQTAADVHRGGCPAPTSVAPPPRRCAPA